MFSLTRFYITDHQEAYEDLNNERSYLTNEKQYQDEQSTIQSQYKNDFSDIIELNVSGQHFATLRSTLCMVKDSMLASMFSGEIVSFLKFFTICKQYS